MTLIGYKLDEHSATGKMLVSLQKAAIDDEIERRQKEFENTPLDVQVMQSFPELIADAEKAAKRTVERIKSDAYRVTLFDANGDVMHKVEPLEEAIAQQLCRLINIDFPPQ